MGRPLNSANYPLAIGYSYFRYKYQDDAEFLQLMIEEPDRANAVITEFLCLTKDKMVDLGPENLNTIISNVIPRLEATAAREDKQIDLELNAEPAAAVYPVYREAAFNVTGKEARPWHE